MIPEEEKEKLKEGELPPTIAYVSAGYIVAFAAAVAIFVVFPAALSLWGFGFWGALGAAASAFFVVSLAMGAVAGLVVVARKRRSIRKPPA